MKKILGISATITLGYLLCSSSAYSLPTYGFDATGSDGPFDQVSGFKLLGTGATGQETENAPVGGNGGLDLWSTTNFLTETFTESFTLLVNSGLNADGANDPFNFNYLGSNVLLDVNLSGTISTPDANGAYTAFFNTDGSSTATMYLDGNGNYDFEIGEDVIAELELTNFIPFGFETSLLGAGATSVDLQFDFTSANAAYWDNAFESLVQQSLMLAITQGDLTLQQLVGDPADGIQYQGWTVIAVDAALTPVPEPATMLLFGAGLLGLAGISRRKKRS